jgi:hypothetical protein
MKKSIVLFYIIFTVFIKAQDVTLLEPVAGGTVEWIIVNQTWTETSINVISGSTYTIMVDGIMSTQGGTYKQHRYYVGPEGLGGSQSSFPIPDVTTQCVIGKIGTDGIGFWVGRVCSFQAKKSGKLYLGINDNQPGDNVGFFVAYIFQKSSFTTSSVKDSPTSFDGINFSINQNYPNPFNPSTTIEYEVSAAGNVELVVYDITGSLIKKLVNDYSQPGQYKIVWDGKNNSGQKVGSGTYFYQIKVNDQVMSKKMIMLK